MRSVERTIEEVLLPSVEAMAGRARAAAAPEYGFAWRYATGWLAATQRIAPPGSRPEGVLVFDATRCPGSRRCTPRPSSSCCAAPGCAR